MGCGKSKQAVATGNTISQTKKSSNGDTKENKDVETIPQNASPNGENAKAGGNEKGNGNVKGGSGDEKVRESEIVEAKDEGVKEGSDQEKELKKENGGGEGNKEKDDETTIEGIISEGISGTSEYYSPNAKQGGSDENPKPNNVIGEENELVEEKEKETNNENATTVTEGSLEKEEVVPTEEAKVSTNTEEEKITNANEENVTETSEIDPKTN